MAHKGAIQAANYIDKPEKGQSNLRINPNNGQITALMDDGREFVFNPVFTAFSITSLNISQSLAVLGSTVDNLDFNWNYNKVNDSQVFNGENLSPEVRNKSLTGLGLTSDANFGLSAYAGSENSNAGVGIHFANHRYFATGPAGVTDISQLKIANQDLGDGKNSQFYVEAQENEKIYFVRPARFGAATYNVGGFEGGFDERTVSITNEYNYTEDYIFGESTNPGLGKTTTTTY